MNDNLNDALAELARDLGVSTGQLWDWMCGNGIESYARAKVATLSSSCVINVIAVVLSCVVMLRMMRVFIHAINGDGLNDDLVAVGSGMVVGLAFLIAVFGLSTLAADVPKLIGWLTAPDGMVLMSLEGMLK